MALRPKSGCSSCGGMRREMGEAIQAHSPARVIKVAVKAIHYNTIKLTDGKAAADKAYQDGKL